MENDRETLLRDCESLVDELGAIATDAIDSLWGGYEYYNNVAWQLGEQAADEIMEQEKTTCRKLLSDLRGALAALRRVEKLN